MGPDLVTVLWISDDPAPAREQVLTEPFVELVQVPAANAALALRLARVHGGVVSVANSRQFEHLLAWGADETIDVHEVTEPTLRSAIQNARARAAARLEVPHRAARADDTPDGAGLALLANAIGHQMTESLAAAIRACGVLERGERSSGPMIGVIIDDDGAGSSGLRRTALVDLRRQLDSANELARRLVALAAPAKLGMCNAVEIVAEAAELVRRDVERFAELELDIPSYACIIPIGRATALNVVSSLVRNAMEAFDGSPGHARGTIKLRVNVESDLVVLEVSDSGGTVEPATRRQALDPTAAAHRAGALGLGLVLAAGHVRNAGGDLLIDSDPELGTTVRIFFPVSSTVSRTSNGAGPVS